MKKITSEKLSNKLTKYGAFSAAIMGAMNASGQIVYTDIADVTVLPGGNYTLDLNNDALGDYLLTVNTAANFAFIQPASGPGATAYNSNGIVGFSSGPYNYPSNLAAGTVIDGTNGIFSSARGDFNYSSCGYPGSQFCDGNDGFVGFHIVVGANTHYGWARIQVAADASSIIIKDYAYNSTPDTPIEAGQTLGLDDNQLSGIKIIAQNKTIELANLTGSVDYTLVSISGQSILKGSTNDSNHVINASTLSDGVYVLELNDANTNATIRKKVIL